MERQVEQVQASATIPGNKYQTAKGIIIEIAISAVGEQLHRHDKSGHILSHPVRPNGVPDRSRFNVGIPPNYFLGVDGPGWGFNPPESVVPVRHTEENFRKKDKSKEPPKMGRPVLPKSPWYAKARGDNSAIPNDILRIAKQSGCYTKESKNYFIVGFEGRSIFSIFRNGEFGFHRDPKTPDFEVLKTRTVKERFMPIRVPLQPIINERKQGRLQAVINALIAQVKNGKGGGLV